MKVQSLDGLRFSEMIVNGAKHLTTHAKMIDALNVFPVPDGDTGTNMNLSMTSGAKEVEKMQTDNIGDVSKAFAKGLLMGARGNSGVILSQLFRGFSKAIEHKETIESGEFASAFSAGVEMAYKAVMKPVEGTILTVAKDAANKAINAAETHDDIVLVMEEVLTEAKESLERTPNLLPVLKDVGVVDSGGQGLVTIYEGFLAVLKGESLPKVSIVEPSMNELVQAEHHKSAQNHMNTEDIEFGYCTEFMVKFEEDKLNEHPFSEDSFRNELSEHGDSLLVVSNEDLVKVHIHAEYPGKALTLGQKYGSLINMKIDNMREQHTNIVSESRTTVKKDSQTKEYGIVAVALGSGMTELFKNMGASVVIEGGQTMNPSTEDIVKAIEETNAENIIILPNNSNIVMTAKQATSVVNKDTIVVPSKTVPQGMSALFAFNQEASLEENEKAMTEALNSVKTGQVTYAVRNTKVDEIEIKKNEFMGILDGKIVVAAPDKNTAFQQLLDIMIEEDDEIVTILQGMDATKDDVENMSLYIEEKFEDIEIEVHHGNQPLYPYIIAVE